MKSHAVIALLLGGAAMFGAEPTQKLAIRGWSFDVPVFLVKSVQQGPDFTVTFLSAKERKMTLGIYEGTCPQEFSQGKNGVREEKEKIVARDTKWALWEETEEGEKSFRAELYLLFDPGSKTQWQFHFFAVAASPADLNLLRHIVRSARRETEANKSADSTASAGNSAAEQLRALVSSASHL